jgi:hypothetical protein
MKSKDEEFAKEVFHEFLLDRREAPLWDEGDEPPDYYLTIGAQRYGVEVTQLMEEFQLGGRNQTPVSVSRYLKSMADRIESEARKRSILNGAYSLWAKAVENLGELEEDIIQEALWYIEHTQNLTTAPPHRITTRLSQSWYVSKINYHKDVVMLANHYKPHVDEKDPVAVSALMRSRVDTKVGKLQRVSLPNILLLLDGFGLASWEVWLRAADLLDTSQLHTIARVTGNRKVQILKSAEVKWQSEGGRITRLLQRTRKLRFLDAEQ